MAMFECRLGSSVRGERLIPLRLRGDGLRADVGLRMLAVVLVSAFAIGCTAPTKTPAPPPSAAQQKEIDDTAKALAVLVSKEQERQAAASRAPAPVNLGALWAASNWQGIIDALEGTDPQGWEADMLIAAKERVGRASAPPPAAVGTTRGNAAGATGTMGAVQQYLHDNYCWPGQEISWCSSVVSMKADSRYLEVQTNFHPAVLQLQERHAAWVPAMTICRAFFGFGTGPFPKGAPDAGYAPFESVRVLAADGQRITWLRDRAVGDKCSY